MRTLSRIGWFCLALGFLAWVFIFWHYGGMENALAALLRALASIFWGGIAIAGLFFILMALLFLNA